MGKMNELDLCVKDLKNAAQSLISVADSLTTLFSGSNRQQENTAEKTEPVTSAKETTLEEVRAVLAEKSRNGHTAKVRELLVKYGAAKLSEIEPSKYDALLADAALIDDAEGEND